MNKNKLLLVVFTSFLLTRCIEDTTTVIRPIVSTRSPDEITKNSARFIGYISQLGDYDILDYGFVWSETPKPTLESEGKIAFGSTITRGEFTADISGLEDGKTYYVRTFVKDSLGVIYDGDVEEDEYEYGGVPFSTLSLSAYSFLPLSAKVGDLITIKGNNFNLVAEDNKVEFGNVKASIEEVLAGVIKVRVPAGITEREVKIYVTVGGKTAVTEDNFNLISGSWLQQADINTARKYPATFVIENKIYLFGGLDENGVSKTELLEYNILTDTWVTKAIFPGKGRTASIAFSLNGKGFVGLGENDGKLMDIWEYDPIENQWTQKDNFPGGIRSGAVGFSIGNNGYVGLGTDGSLKKDFWKYNPLDDSWKQISDFPGTARYGSAFFILDNKAFIGTGIDGSGLQKDFYSYTPSTDTWQQKQDFPSSARYMASAFALKGKGYVGLGYSTKELSDFLEYDPGNEKWYLATEFTGGARYAAFAVNYQDRAFVGGGKTTNGNARDFWEILVD